MDEKSMKMWVDELTPGHHLYIKPIHAQRTRRRKARAVNMPKVLGNLPGAPITKAHRAYYGGSMERKIQRRVPFGRCYAHKVVGARMYYFHPTNGHRMPLIKDRYGVYERQETKRSRREATTFELVQ